MWTWKDAFLSLAFVDLITFMFLLVDLLVYYWYLG